MENLTETQVHQHFLQAGASDMPAEIRKPIVSSCSLQIKAQIIVENKKNLCLFYIYRRAHLLER